MVAAGREAGHDSWKIEGFQPEIMFPVINSRIRTQNKKYCRQYQSIAMLQGLPPQHTKDMFEKNHTFQKMEETWPMQL
jgi:hypothetical protein